MLASDLSRCLSLLKVRDSASEPLDPRWSECAALSRDDREELDALTDSLREAEEKNKELARQVEFLQTKLAFYANVESQISSSEQVVEETLEKVSRTTQACVRDKKQIRFMFEQLDSLRDRVEMLGESLRSEEVARASRSDDLLRWEVEEVPCWCISLSLVGVRNRPCKLVKPGEVCCAVSVLSSDNIRHSRDVSLRHTLPSQDRSSPHSVSLESEQVIYDVRPQLSTKMVRSAVDHVEFNETLIITSVCNEPFEKSFPLDGREVTLLLSILNTEFGCVGQVLVSLSAGAQLEQAWHVVRGLDGTPVMGANGKSTSLCFSARYSTTSTSTPLSLKDANPTRGDVVYTEGSSSAVLQSEGQDEIGREIREGEVDEVEIARKIQEVEDKLAFCMNFIENQRSEDKRFVDNFNITLSEMRGKLQDSVATLDSQMASSKLIIRGLKHEMRKEVADLKRAEAYLTDQLQEVSASYQIMKQAWKEELTLHELALQRELELDELVKANETLTRDVEEFSQLYRQLKSDNEKLEEELKLATTRSSSAEAKVQELMAERESREKARKTLKEEIQSRDMEKMRVKLQSSLAEIVSGSINPQSPEGLDANLIEPEQHKVRAAPQQRRSNRIVSPQLPVEDTPPPQPWSPRVFLPFSDIPATSQHGQDKEARDSQSSASDVEEGKWEGNVVLIRALRARIAALQKALTTTKEDLISSERRVVDMEDKARSLARELQAEREKHRCHVALLQDRLDQSNRLASNLRAQISPDSWFNDYPAELTPEQGRTAKPPDMSSRSINPDPPARAEEDKSLSRPRAGLLAGSIQEAESYWLQAISWAK
uniref:Uncharacterized protein n=1 Tax=Hanusia phi TaxID=3032 RepID=A0A7S0H988_9CRYP